MTSVPFRRTALAAGLVALAVAFAPAADRIPKAADGAKAPAAPNKHPRGLKRTPQHKLHATPRFAPAAAAPAQFAVVPSKLSYWLNNQIGCCVSTFEVAYSLAAYSTLCTGTEVFVPDQVFSQWVYSHHYDDGADLSDVMTTFQRDGITVDGKTYTGGPFQIVDYSNEAVLQAAIATGPVPIAIDADALPSGAGNGSGWYATGGRPGQFQNIDHCIGFTGYGSADYCFGQLGKPVPAGLDKSRTYYMIFTWGGIGVVDHPWVMSTTQEAYLRAPTIQGMSPPTPGPGPGPGPNPTPTPAPVTITLTGTTQPYTFTVGHWPMHQSVTIPGQTVSVTGQLPAGVLPGGSAKAGLSLDLVFALIRLGQDIRASGHGRLIADFEAVMAAIRSGSGTLAALEQLATDLIAVGSDPSVIADLLRVARDLGLPVPDKSPLFGK